MAVKGSVVSEVKSEAPKEIRSYWPHFHLKAVLLVVGLNLLIVASLSVGLVLSGNFTFASPMLWVLVFTVFIFSVLSGIFIVTYTGRPTQDLLSALIQVAGEPSVTTPTNPNDPRYANTGFQVALKTIYELAGNRDTTNTPTTTQVDTTNSLVLSALDTTLCGFIILDHSRKVIYANKPAPIHIDAEQVSTLSLMFNGNDTLDAWLDDCELNAVHAEHTWTRIGDRLPEEEGRRLFDVIASYDKGAVGETVLTLIDRTSSYSVSEEELDFIAFAAHELRGPITVIRGYLDVLKDELADVLQDDQAELFRRLTVSANRLSGYINNILNTSRFDRRHLKVHLGEDSLAAIYEIIRDDMDLRAKAQNRLLTVAIPADLPTIAADRASISEVMGNLIDNAIKYSNEGGVINATATVRDNFVEFSVEDHGIGMPGNVVSNLFQKFYRSHRSRETVAGTGIGLYISKAIVESHGGKIGVHSVEGEGSTFTVDLPIYSTVADKLKADDNNNEGLIDKGGNGWIKNHSMFRS